MASVTSLGDNMSYSIEVTGMSSSGIVVVQIPENAAADAAGNLSNASTSSHNMILWELPDSISPSVTINQAEGQMDPCSDDAICFMIEFSEPVDDFTYSDISFEGSTAEGPLTASVAEVRDNMVYTATVTGMTGAGIVKASIPAGAAADAAGNYSLESTSTDNMVEWIPRGYNIAITMPENIQYSDKTNISAKLTDTGVPVPGKILTFSLNGTVIGRVQTDVYGIAALKGYGITLRQGEYPV
jgi:hypothetical protein